MVTWWIIAGFLYLQIGFRLGYYSVIVWKKCAESADWRTGKAAYLLFPSHAGRLETWSGGDFPIIANEFDSPYAYGALLALLWPAKLMVNIFCYAVRFFLPLLKVVCAPEMYIRDFMGRRKSERTPVETVAASEPEAVSPAARLDEIQGQIDRLLVEKRELEQRPDITRL